MEFGYAKALHIIFIVTWFAGLFYIVRLFIYQVEAQEKPEEERRVLVPQFKIMAKRLWYGITWPSAILATVFAIWMLVINPAYLTLPWMHLKLGFVFFLFLYQGICQRIFKKIQNDLPTLSSFKLRLWNEVATIILIAVVFIVVLKDTFSWVWGMVGLALVFLAFFIAARLYKKWRSENETKSNKEKNDEN